MSPVRPIRPVSHSYSVARVAAQRPLFLRDKTLGKQALNAPPQLWPKGSLRYLVSAGQFTWKQFGLPLNASALQVLVESDTRGLKRAGTDAQQVMQVYQDLCQLYTVPAQDIPTVRPLAEQWLRDRLMSFGIDRASAAAAAGDPEAAIDIIRKSRLAPAVGAASVSLEATTPDFLQRLNTPAAGALPTGLQENRRCLAWGLPAG